MTKDEDIVFVDDGCEEYLDDDHYYTIQKARRYTENSNVDAFFEKGYSLARDGDFWLCDIGYFQPFTYRVFETRCRLKDFNLNKSLRRVLKKNADTKSIVRPLWITPGKSALFEKHYARYGEKIYKSLRDKYKYGGYHDGVRERELCVLKGDRLLACSIFIETDKSIQSNCAFWDLDEPKRSLGVLTVLLEMEYGARTGKQFYYLGPYFKQNPNYQYKARFPGLEFYDWDRDVWVDKKDAGYLLDQKLKRKEVLPHFDYNFLEHLLPAPTHGLFPEIAGVALFGSRARGTERPDSDMDVLILTPDIEKHFTDDHYASCFGNFRYARREKWCDGFTTLRSFYREEHGQIELNFAPPSWAELPANSEAQRIVKDGIRILHDPHGILERLVNAVKKPSRKKTLTTRAALG